MKCKHQGRKRRNIPHKPCCPPHECSHPKTPLVVSSRMCSASRCRYFTTRGRQG